MGCDFYIYTYLYVYFLDNEKITSYIPIFIKCKRGYFNDDDDYDDLIPNKPVLIYSATNNFVNTNYYEKYKEFIQDQLDNRDQKWENITKIKKIERRVERF